MFAPIRMVDITNVDSTPEIAAAVVFTPTFIITDGKRELTRMKEYMSEDFWSVLEMILERETELRQQVDEKTRNFGNMCVNRCGRGRLC